MEVFNANRSSSIPKVQSKIRNRSTTNKETPVDEYQRRSHSSNPRDYDITTNEAWCPNKNNQLGLKEQRLLSNTAQYHPGEAQNEARNENCSDIQKLSPLAEPQVSQKTASVNSLFEFEGDLFYFNRNNHPSIQEMIAISEGIDVRYDKVFNRFNELRSLNSVTCSVNDICVRVSKYFDPTTSYNIAMIEKKVLTLHEEFKKFGRLGPVLCTGNVHEIVDKVLLPPDIVREYYFEWYTNSHKAAPGLSLLISEEQKLLHEEMDKRIEFPNAIQADHDYVRDEMPHDCKLRSIMRIIRRKPDLTVSDGLVLSKLYNVDIKLIQKLIQDDEDVMFNVHHSQNGIFDFRKHGILIGKSPEVIHVSTINAENYAVRQEAVEKEYKPIDMLKSPDLPREIYNEREFVVTQYEDIVDSEVDDQFPPIVSSSGPLDSRCRDHKDRLHSNCNSSPNQFPEDFSFFNKNRHPSIEEMIDISKKMKITYRQVFYRFRDLRSAFKESCSAGDICRRVLKLFAHRAVFDGVLDASTVNYMYELFDKFGNVGKNPDIGYTHLVAEKVDLPAFIVREQYKEWYLELNDLNPLQGLEAIHSSLENEFHKNNDLSYERLLHLTGKYGTTQKLILNSFRSYSKKIENNQNMKIELVPSKSTPVSEKISQLASSNVDNKDSDFNLGLLPSKSLSTAKNFDALGLKSVKIEENQLYYLNTEDDVKDHKSSVFETEGQNLQILKNCFYEVSGGNLCNLFGSTSLTPPPVALTRGDNIQKARKIQFHMEKPPIYLESSSEAKRSKLSSIGSETVTLNQSMETGDEEVDIVSFDANLKETAIDELARTFAQSHPTMYEFPGDLELFSKNRHPSINDMVEIADNVGITYEEVFFRFQHLRKLKDETCVVGDNCQKVEIFNQIYPQLNGVLDEKSLIIMHKEFETLSHFGPLLPLGNIHLIMEKVELPSRVVRMQYAEWYMNRIKNQTAALNQFSSTIAWMGPVPEYVKDAHLDEKKEVALEPKHEPVGDV